MSGGVYLSGYILVVSCGHTTNRDVVAAQVLKEKGLSTVGHTGKNAHTEIGAKVNTHPKLSLGSESPEPLILGSMLVSLKI